MRKIGTCLDLCLYFRSVAQWAQSLNGFEWEGDKPFIYGYESGIPVQRLEPFWRALRSMRSVDSDALGAIISNAGQSAPQKSEAENIVGDEGENEI